MDALELVAGGQLQLRSGSTLRIEDGAGVVIEVCRGAIWLTQERDARDYYLHAGDWFRLDREGATVVSPMAGDAEVELTTLRQDSHSFQP